MTVIIKRIISTLLGNSREWITGGMILIIVDWDRFLSIYLNLMIWCKKLWGLLIRIDYFTKWFHIACNCPNKRIIAFAHIYFLISRHYQSLYWRCRRLFNLYLRFNNWLDNLLFFLLFSISGGFGIAWVVFELGVGFCEFLQKSSKVFSTSYLSKSRAKLIFL